MLSSILIGSNPAVPACTFDVTCNAVTTGMQIDAGSYYLADPTDDLSLLAQLEAEIDSHAEVAAVNVYLGEDRKVHITTTPATAISWTGDVTARNMLGFSGGLASATTHNASLISAYLWSPARTETSEARLGTLGRSVYDTKVGASGTSRMRAGRHNTVVLNEFSWRYVENDRVWTESELGGEWVAFFDQVLSRFWQFKLYRERDDDEASTTDISISTTGQLGPYKMRPPRGPVAWDLKREIPMVEALHPIELPVIVVPEYE